MSEGLSGRGFRSVSDYLGPPNSAGDPAGATRVPLLFAQMIGYNPATDNGTCTNPLGAAGAPYDTPALLANRNIQMLDTATASFASQTQVLGNLFNGKEWSGRFAPNLNPPNRVSFHHNSRPSPLPYSPLY